MNESGIKKVIVVSNTHWDREFRKSFEKTRHSLLRMMDTTVEILENEPGFHSFTMDGHTIMIDDYLEIRPEMRKRVEKLVMDGRLIIGPYFTLAEEFSIGDEALVRNLIWGKKKVQEYGGKPGTVAYTPSSWGQTGQYPQILKDFGLDKMMFYRGISHHESDAEYIWAAPDGTQVYASRFAIYARYNWYYQVHRMVTRGTVFDKEYQWGKYSEVPVRKADLSVEKDPSFDLQIPGKRYNKDLLRKAIEDMLKRESGHFTTPVFLAMNGHDISVAHPGEPVVIKDADSLFGDELEIKQGSLEDFWNEAMPYLKAQNLPILKGERRSFLKEGMWTYLFPGTISARTYLKQKDYRAFSTLKNEAEPMASIALSLGKKYPQNYLEKGWTWLMSNHTHDANGGCAPDSVCQDMEYRYRKVNDISEIVKDESNHFILKNLSPIDMPADAMQLVIFNSRPFRRDEVILVDLEIPESWNAKSVKLTDPDNNSVEYQPVINEKSSVFVDSIWDVPCILPSSRIRFYAHVKDIPATGYKAFQIIPQDFEYRGKNSLLTGPVSMENEFLSVNINPNGTVNLLNKKTSKWFRNLNYLYDQGEAGNAWQHVDLKYDKKINSLGVSADISILEEGPLSSTICAEFNLKLPAEYINSEYRSDNTVEMPVRISYILEKGCKGLKVKIELDNNARDHWLRVCFPTNLKTGVSHADSHFDVVERNIELPDSTGWVEEALGTHPLQSFVSLNDESEGIAVCPKGLFEYEVFSDEQNTIALTLLRACRIKLKVSEEKVSELEDRGIQCPGKQIFEYMIYPFSGDWSHAQIFKNIAYYHTPLTLIQGGTGKGELPPKYSLLESMNPEVVISAIKKSETGENIIVRLFNPCDTEQELEIRFNDHFTKISDCGMAEDRDELLEENSNQLNYRMKPKKILTLRLIK